LLQGEDLSALLVLYSSTGDVQGITKLAEMAKEKGSNNIAFLCYYLLRRTDAAIQLLIETNRVPEAGLLARTYSPSAVSDVVREWRKDLQTVSEKAAESLADPAEYENLFPDFRLAVAAEKRLKQDRFIPAGQYARAREELDRDIVAELKSRGVTGYEEDLSAANSQKQNGSPAPSTPSRPVAASPAPVEKAPTPAPVPVSAATPVAASTPVKAPTPTPTPVAPVSSPAPVQPSVPAVQPRPASPATASPPLSPATQRAPTSPVSTPAHAPTSTPLIPSLGAPSSPNQASPSLSPAASPRAAPKAPAVASLIDFGEEEDDLAAEIEAQLREEEGKAD
jgi:coatomer subunit beta'